MAFSNVKRILGIGSPLSSFKLLLIQSMSSRPKYRTLARGLLGPFIHNGEVSIRYRCYERFYRTFLRTTDLSADLLSTSELCFRDIYHLDHDRSFAPDVVIDGGGNIGLFTLRAAAALSTEKKKPTKLNSLRAFAKEYRTDPEAPGYERHRGGDSAVLFGGHAKDDPFLLQGGK